MASVSDVVKMVGLNIICQIALRRTKNVKVVIWLVITHHCAGKIQKESITSNLVKWMAINQATPLKLMFGSGKISGNRSSSRHWIRRNRFQLKSNGTLGLDATREHKCAAQSI